MTRRAVYAVVALAAVAGLVALPPSVEAEEGLLWKVNSRYHPAVVPPYTNQPGPFPMGETQEAEQEKIALEMMETERLHQEVIKRARQLIDSPQALLPYLGGMAVGGLVEGAHGRKVLVGNEWIGPGMDLTVRLIVSEPVKAALDEVNAFDPAAASELRIEMVRKLQKNPVTKLKLKEIRSNALVLESAHGQKVLEFNVR